MFPVALERSSRLLVIVFQLSKILIAIRHGLFMLVAGFGQFRLLSRKPQILRLAVSLFCLKLPLEFTDLLPGFPQLSPEFVFCAVLKRHRETYSVVNAARAPPCRYGRAQEFSVIFCAPPNPVTMRKRIVGQPEDAEGKIDAHLPIKLIAEVEVTSGLPDYPVDAAMHSGIHHGWRASTPGEQRLTIVFDQPEVVRKLTFEVR